MKIIQVLPTISYGDAVGNDTVALYHTIKKLGYKTAIYAENVDARLKNSDIKHISDLPKMSERDVVLYHLSTGTKLNYELEKLACKKIIVYHNVTPPHFFNGYSDISKELCTRGLQGAKYLAGCADYCLADSLYNKRDLEEMGYKCPIDVLPILIPFDDYKKMPSKKVLNRYAGDEYTNVLFTGRIAPNKKQEDVIEAFYYYNKYVNSKSRLFIVGSYGGMEKYYNELQAYAQKLGLKNVIFTGHIKFDEILAYYKVADLFLCMSEHEGFCVPLVEAMFFDIPVVAYDSSAIADTLGGSGFLLKQKNGKETAEVMHRILSDEKLRGDILYNQRLRLQDFRHEVIETMFIGYLTNFLEENSQKEG